MNQFFKRSILTAMLLGASVSVTGISQAQTAEPKRHGRAGQFDPNMTPEQRIEKRLEHMKSKLSLSEAQITQLRAIMKEDAADLKAAREAMKAASGDAKKEAREKMVAQMKTSKERVAAVLTEDQRKQMKEQFKEGRGKMRDLKMKQRQERLELRQELRDEKK